MMINLLLALGWFFGFHSPVESEMNKDPNFVIVESKDKGFRKFKKKVVVFEIPIYAAKKVADEKLLHAANILAQYLDNNEDSIVDNPLVHQKMIENKAFLFMWSSRLNFIGLRQPDGAIGQDLGNEETHPEWHANKTGRFDASLEEVWHLVTHAGYSKAYPSIFGESDSSKMCVAMDTARGGHFVTIPKSYPEKAWYSYYDQTCEYDCMATEYFYWSMTALLGAQQNRAYEIGEEWSLHTAELFEEKDSLMFQLLTNPTYHLPTVLPDGTYRH